MGIAPGNTGWLDAAETAAGVLGCTEIDPLQRRFTQLSYQIGNEVMRFNP
jgi:hypothetical protein